MDFDGQLNRFHQYMHRLGHLKKTGACDTPTHLLTKFYFPFQISVVMTFLEVSNWSISCVATSGSEHKSTTPQKR